MFRGFPLLHRPRYKTVSQSGGSGKYHSEAVKDRMSFRTPSARLRVNSVRNPSCPDDRIGKISRCARHDNGKIKNHETEEFSTRGRKEAGALRPSVARM
jgi:hypothetical protein